MPPGKFIKSKKSNRIGITYDNGANVELLNPNTKFSKGKTGKWGLTTNDGETFEVLENFDGGSVPAEFILKKNDGVSKSEDTPSPVPGGAAPATAPATAPAQQATKKQWWQTPEQTPEPNDDGQVLNKIADFRKGKTKFKDPTIQLFFENLANETEHPEQKVKGLEVAQKLVNGYYDQREREIQQTHAQAKANDRSMFPDPALEGGFSYSTTQDSPEKTKELAALNANRIKELKAVEEEVAPAIGKGAYVPDGKGGQQQINFQRSVPDFTKTPYYTKDLFSIGLEYNRVMGKDYGESLKDKNLNYLERQITLDGAAVRRSALDKNIANYIKQLPAKSMNGALQTQAITDYMEGKRTKADLTYLGIPTEIVEDLYERGQMQETYKDIMHQDRDVRKGELESLVINQLTKQFGVNQGFMGIKGWSVEQMKAVVDGYKKAAMDPSQPQLDQRDVAIFNEIFAEGAVNAVVEQSALVNPFSKYNQSWLSGAGKMAGGTVSNAVESLAKDILPGAINLAGYGLQATGKGISFLTAGRGASGKGRYFGKPFEQIIDSEGRERELREGSDKDAYEVNTDWRPDDTKFNPETYLDTNEQSATFMQQKKNNGEVGGYSARNIFYNSAGMVGQLAAQAGMAALMPEGFASQVFLPAYAMSFESNYKSSFDVVGDEAPWKNYAYGAIMSAVEGLTEKFGNPIEQASFLTKGILPIKQQIGDLLGNMTSEQLRNMGAGGFKAKLIDALTTNLKGTLKGFAKGAGEGLLQMAGESNEEAVGRIAQNVTDMVFTGKSKPILEGVGQTWMETFASMSLSGTAGIKQGIEQSKSFASNVGQDALWQIASNRGLVEAAIAEQEGRGAITAEEAGERRRMAGIAYQAKRDVMTVQEDYTARDTNGLATNNKRPPTPHKTKFQTMARANVLDLDARIEQENRKPAPNTDLVSTLTEQKKKYEALSGMVATGELQIDPATGQPVVAPQVTTDDLPPFFNNPNEVTINGVTYQVKPDTRKDEKIDNKEKARAAMKELGDRDREKKEEEARQAATNPVVGNRVVPLQQDATLSHDETKRRDEAKAKISPLEKLISALENNTKKLKEQADEKIGLPTEKPLRKQIAENEARIAKEKKELKQHQDTVAEYDPDLVKLRKYNEQHSVMGDPYGAPDASLSPKEQVAHHKLNVSQIEQHERIKTRLAQRQQRKEELQAQRGQRVAEQTGQTEQERKASQQNKSVAQKKYEAEQYRIHKRSIDAWLKGANALLQRSFPTMNAQQWEESVKWVRQTYDGLLEELRYAATGTGTMDITKRLAEVTSQSPFRELDQQNKGEATPFKIGDLYSHAGFTGRLQKIDGHYSLINGKHLFPLGTDPVQVAEKINAIAPPSIIAPGVQSTLPTVTVGGEGQGGTEARPSTNVRLPDMQSAGPVITVGHPQPGVVVVPPGTGPTGPVIIVGGEAKKIENMRNDDFMRMYFTLEDEKAYEQLDEKGKADFIRDKKAEVIKQKTGGEQKTGTPQQSTVDNTIAADYLLTGGLHVILSTDYLLKGIAGLFTNAGNLIDNIRNKYAQELSDKNLVDVKNFVGSETYNKIIDEIRAALNASYNNSEEVQKILDDVLKYPTGMPQRIGFSIESRVENLEPKNEGGQSTEGKESTQESTGGKARGTGKVGQGHAEAIKKKFREVFKAKGISDEQIDGAIAIMDARANIWASEEKGRTPDQWFERIADIGTGDFEADSKEILFQVLDDINLFTSNDLKAATEFITKVFNTIDNAEDAKKAYRKLSVKYHPDRNPSPTATAIMQHLNKVNDAWKPGSAKTSYSSFWDDINRKGQQSQQSQQSKQQSGQQQSGQQQSAYDKMYEEIKRKGEEKRKKNDARAAAFTALRERQAREYADFEKQQKAMWEEDARLTKQFRAARDAAWQAYKEKRERLQNELSKIPYTDRAARDAKQKEINDVRNAQDAGDMEGLRAKDQGERQRMKEREARRVEHWDRVREQNAQFEKDYPYAFQDQSGTKKGALETLADGRVVIHALESPDFSTMVHEIAHLFEKELTAEEQAVIKENGGSEGFARAFERYLRDGKAPVPEMKTLFEKFEKWLKDIYENLIGSPISNRVSPEVKKIFDRLLAGHTLTESISVADTIKEVEEGKLNADDAAIRLDESGVEVTNDIYDELRAAEKRHIKSKTGLQVGDKVVVRGKNGNVSSVGDFRGTTNDGRYVVVIRGMQGVYDKEDVTPIPDQQAPVPVPEEPDEKQDRIDAVSKRLHEFPVGSVVTNTVAGDVVEIISKDGKNVTVKTITDPSGNAPAKEDIHTLNGDVTPHYYLPSDLENIPANTPSASPDSMPKTVRELSELAAEQGDDLISGAFFSSLKQGDQFTLNGKVYTVEKITKGKPNVYYTKNHKEVKYIKHTIKISQGDKKINGELWLYPNGSGVWFGRGQTRKSDPWGQLSRDIEGQVTVDLLNENNRFHTPSGVFNKIQNYINELNNETEIEGQEATTGDGEEGGEESTASDGEKIKPLKKRKRPSKILNKTFLRALDYVDPSPRTVVMQYFIQGGKISSGIIKGLFGGGGKKINEELKARFQLYKKNDGESIKGFADRLYHAQSEELQEVYGPDDFQTAIEQVLLDYTTPSQMADAIVAEIDKAAGLISDAEEWIASIPPELEEWGLGLRDGQIVLKFMEFLTDEEIEAIANMNQEALNDSEYVKALMELHGMETPPVPNPFEQSTEQGMFYHGTPHGIFSEFDENARGTGLDQSSYGDYGRGFYFTQSREEAHGIANGLVGEGVGNTPHVVRVFLDMRNPFDMSVFAAVENDIRALASKHGVLKIPKKEMNAVYKKHGITADDYEFFLDVAGDMQDNWGDWDIPAKLKQRGYDSIITDGTTPEYIVFDKAQIQIIPAEAFGEEAAAAAEAAEAEVPAGPSAKDVALAELAVAEKELAAARKELSEAQHKLAKEGAQQNNLFSPITATQQGMFARDDAAEILAPLKAKVTELEQKVAELDRKAQAAVMADQPALFDVKDLVPEQAPLIENLNEGDTVYFNGKPHTVLSKVKMGEWKVQIQEGNKTPFWTNQAALESGAAVPQQEASAVSNTEYFLTQRPPSIGTHPTEGLVSVTEESRNGRKVWRLVYDRTLTDDEVKRFELKYILNPELLGRTVGSNMGINFTVTAVDPSSITLSTEVNGKTKTETHSANAFKELLDSGRRTMATQPAAAPAEPVAPPAPATRKQNKTNYNYTATDSKGNHLYTAKDGLSATYPYVVVSPDGHTTNSLVYLKGNNEFPDFWEHDIENGSKTFTTHTGEKVFGKRLNDALNKVADDMVEAAKRERQEPYASHVTDEQKDEFLAKGLEYAEQIRNGEHLDNLTIWQRVNTELTGESVPLISPKNTPAAPPPAAPPAPPRKKPERKIRDEKDQKDIDDAWDDFLKGGGGLTSGGIDPVRLEKAVKLVGMYLKKGVHKFSDIIEDAYAKFGDALANYFDEIKDAYAAYYNRATDEEAEKMDTSLRSFTYKNLIDDVYNRPADSESDSTGTGTSLSENESNVPGDATGSGENGSGSTQSSESNVGGRTGSTGSNGLFTVAIGKRGDNEVDQPEEGIQSAGGVAGVIDGRGNSITGTTGVYDGRRAGEETGEDFEKPAGSFSDRVKIARQKQIEAEGTPHVVMNRENIAASVPFLLPEQQDDVYKAERRFNSPEHQTQALAYGKGMMFTNGTGTGKTFTGLGIVKRFVQQGKTNILIVVPATKVQEWSDDARNLMLNITPIQSKKDPGGGLNVVGWEMFTGSTALPTRDFDLIVYDESHTIMADKDGNESSTTRKHYQMSNRDEYAAFARITSVHPVWQEYDQVFRQYQMVNASLNSDTSANPAADEIRVRELDQRLEELSEQKKQLTPELQERAKAAVKNTKVVFLSATPFKGHYNLEYVNGYLFDWGRETTYIQLSNTMSNVNPRAQFLLDNFGAAYEWKRHRIEPKKPANPAAVSMNEVAFSEKLMKSGAMSGRTIESDRDYSREFPLVAGFNSTMFNQAFSDLMDYNTNRYAGMREAARKVFYSYDYTVQLFESLKASLMTERIQQHLDLGRKVVVFHRRRQSIARPPFRDIIDQTIINAKAALADPNTNAENLAKAQDHIDQALEFELKYAELLEYEMELDYRPAVEQLAEAFPKAVFLNGSIGPNQKPLNIKEFNKDNSGADVIVVQEKSGSSGISLHDTSGKHQRALVSLSMPNSTITALQAEGRIFRIGNESDAIIEYPLLGLDMEIAYYGNNLNTRLSTTENLAVGDQARDLATSFAEGVMFHATTDAPHAGQGKGGRAFDKKVQSVETPFEKAKLVYASNQKTQGRRDQRQGYDYFPTPEPLGERMVEWGGARAGESFMEPSAGNGAIAMWVPTTMPLTAIEPTYDLYSKLTGRSGGANKKIINGDFESYNQINKFDVITMNPPFGDGGKLAMEHLEKAFNHLRNGGRIVAIIPAGPSMDKRMNAFLYGDNGKGKLNNPSVHLRKEIQLPSVAFAQAGTSASTKVVIIDKINVVPEGMELTTSKVDLSFVKTINELFDEIEGLSTPDRYRPAVREQQEMTALQQLEDLLSGAASPSSIQSPATGPIQKTSAEIVHPIQQYVHTKTGEVQYLAKTEHVETKEYREMASIAKANGGYYSSYAKAKGFLFKTKEDAEKFRAQMNGTVGNSPTAAAELVAEIKALPLSHVSGLKMGAKQAAGIYISTEAANRYATPETPSVPVQVIINNPKESSYHENGLEQIEALTELAHTGQVDWLGLSDDLIPDFYDFSKGDHSPQMVTNFLKGRFGPNLYGLNEEHFNMSARAQAATLITERYVSEGYDALYFRASNTQEGELIVFDREKVVFGQQPPRYNIVPVDTPMSMMEAEATATKAQAFAKHELGVTVKIVATTNDLPPELRPSNMALDKNAFPGVVGTDGTVYLVVSEIAKNGDPELAHRTVLHEIVAHKGLAAAFGDKLNTVMQMVYTNMPAEARERIANAYGEQLKGLSEAEQQALIGEEYAARVAEGTLSKPSWWSAFLTRIKTAMAPVLNRLGIGLSDRDINNMLWDAKSKLRTGAIAAAKFSIVDLSANELVEYYRALAPYENEDLEVDKMPPLKNPDGSINKKVMGGMLAFSVPRYILTGKEGSEKVIKVLTEMNEQLNDPELAATIEYLQEQKRYIDAGVGISQKMVEGNDPNAAKSLSVRMDAGQLFSEQTAKVYDALWQKYVEGTPPTIKQVEAARYNIVPAGRTKEQQNSSLHVAMQMNMADMTPKQIAVATNWVFDKANKRWTWYTDVSKYKLKPGVKFPVQGQGVVKLGRVADIIQADELFEMFPEIANKVVYAEYDNNRNSIGAASENFILLNSAKISVEDGGYSQKKYDSLMGVMVHEMQHFIQYETGMEKGSSIEIEEKRVQGIVSSLQTMAKGKNAESKEAIQEASQLLADQSLLIAEVTYRRTVGEVQAVEAMQDQRVLVKGAMTPDRKPGTPAGRYIGIGAPNEYRNAYYKGNSFLHMVEDVVLTLIADGHLTSDEAEAILEGYQNPKVNSAADRYFGRLVTDVPVELSTKNARELNKIVRNKISEAVSNNLSKLGANLSMLEASRFDMPKDSPENSKTQLEIFNDMYNYARTMRKTGVGYFNTYLDSLVSSYAPQLGFTDRGRALSSHPEFIEAAKMAWYDSGLADHVLKAAEALHAHGNKIGQDRVIQSIEKHLNDNKDKNVITIGGQQYTKTQLNNILNFLYHRVDVVAYTAREEAKQPRGGTLRTMTNEDFQAILRKLAIWGASEYSRGNKAIMETFHSFLAEVERDTRTTVTTISGNSERERWVKEAYDQQMRILEAEANVKGDTAGTSRVVGNLMLTQELAWPAFMQEAKKLLDYEVMPLKEMINETIQKLREFALNNNVDQVLEVIEQMKADPSKQLYLHVYQIVQVEVLTKAAEMSTGEKRAGYEMQIAQIMGQLRSDVQLEARQIRSLEWIYANLLRLGGVARRAYLTSVFDELEQVTSKERTERQQQLEKLAKDNKKILKEIKEISKRAAQEAIDAAEGSKVNSKIQKLLDRLCKKYGA